MIQDFTDLKLAAELLQAGLPPFWCERLSCGTPLFATPSLGLAYPGTLLFLHLPLHNSAAWSVAWVLYAAAHLVLAWLGARRLQAGPYQAMMIAAALALWDLAAGAWVLWILALEARGMRSAAFAWAMLLLSGVWAYALLPPLIWARQGVFGMRRLLPAALGLGLAAPWVLPCGEALLKTSVPDMRAGAIPADDPLVARRGERVALAPGLEVAGFAGARGLAAQGYHLAWGALRQTREMGTLARLLAQVSPEFPSILGAMGASWTYDGKAFARHRAPARVALVSLARRRGQGSDALRLETRPLFERPLILEEAQGGQEGMGASWTLLAERPGLDGSLSLRLPKGHAGGWVYSSDAWYPGWKASLDGKSRPVVRAERAFRAVRVEPGEEELCIAYLSLPFLLGVGIALACLVFLVRPG